MTPLSLFHLLPFVLTIAVAAYGVAVLIRRRAILSPLGLAAVALSTVAALYSIAASYGLSNILTCRADATLCLAGSVTQLLRNTALLLFLKAISRPSRG